MNNKVFYQHPNLMRVLGMHETVMEVMVNVLGEGESKVRQSMEMIRRTRSKPFLNGYSRDHIQSMIVKITEVLSSLCPQTFICIHSFIRRSPFPKWWPVAVDSCVIFVALVVTIREPCLTISATYWKTATLDLVSLFHVSVSSCVKSRGLTWSDISLYISINLYLQLCIFTFTFGISSALCLCSLASPSMRGATPLDVAAASVMDNNELALALREPDLEKVSSRSLPLSTAIYSVLSV